MRKSSLFLEVSILSEEGVCNSRAEKWNKTSSLAILIGECTSTNKLENGWLLLGSSSSFLRRKVRNRRTSRWRKRKLWNPEWIASQVERETCFSNYLEQQPSSGVDRFSVWLAPWKQYFLLRILPAVFSQDIGPQQDLCSSRCSSWLAWNRPKRIL